MNQKGQCQIACHIKFHWIICFENHLHVLENRIAAILILPFLYSNTIKNLILRNKSTKTSTEIVVEFAAVP